jgi:hypothetical protein
MEKTEIKIFIKSVNEYLSLIEGIGKIRAYELLFRAAVILPNVYSLGMMLPDVDPSTSGPERYNGKSMMGEILGKMGKYDNYSEIFDPVFENECVVGSLSDDLADIYTDLKGPMISFESGNKNDAIWQWKFNLKTHCGDHLVDSLRVIHRLVNDHMDPDYENK